ncbi:MAG: phasin family protein [Balneolales bacterium]|nr:phasin family protein [Balneolales bacterium]
MSNQKEDKHLTAVESLTGKAREVWLAGLGALASVEEEGSKVFNKLVDKGEKFEERGKKQLDEAYDDLNKTYKEFETKLKSTFSKAEGEIDDNLQELVHKMGVPTQEEIKELTSQVEKLVKKVDQLSKKVDQADKKADQAKDAANTTK